MTNPHEEFLALLEPFKKANPELDLPPKSFTEMKAQVTAFDPNGSLSVSFPFDARFTNPTGVFQGGMLSTAADNVFGPLSYFMAKRPTVTLDLTCHYVRPFLPKDAALHITAKVVSQTKQFILMEGTLQSKEGKLIATASSQCFISGAVKGN